MLRYNTNKREVHDKLTLTSSIVWDHRPSRHYTTAILEQKRREIKSTLPNIENSFVHDWGTIQRARTLLRLANLRVVEPMIVKININYKDHTAVQLRVVLEMLGLGVVSEIWPLLIVSIRGTKCRNLPLSSILSPRICLIIARFYRTYWIPTRSLGPSGTSASLGIYLWELEESESKQSSHRCWICLTPLQSWLHMLSSSYLCHHPFYLLGSCL